MSRKDDNQVIPKVKYEYQVCIDYDHSIFDYDKTYFTLIDKYYTDKKPNSSGGILHYFSLDSIVDFINKEVKTVKDKNACPSILKGIYKGGTSGNYCTVSSPFLFLDVDVKKGENDKLFDRALNSLIFEKLEKSSLFTFRSYSKKGFASCVHVPELEKFDVSQKREHLIIAREVVKKIRDWIYEETGVIVRFDDAQNKFRQIRKLAPQDRVIGINKHAPTFIVERSDIILSTTHTGVPLFTKPFCTASKHSIEYQYNQCTRVTEILKDYHVHGDRYRLPGTTNETSGFVDELKNVFVNFSTTFSNYTSHTPFWLSTNLFYDGDHSRFKSELVKQGYSVSSPKEEELENYLSLLGANDTRNEKIYEICNELRVLPLEEKYGLIDRLNVSKERLAKIEVYLEVSAIKITYDKTFEIDSYVSECFEEILDYVDQNHRICVKSETGTGKTTAIIKNFNQIRESSRCLIIEPLTSIVDQLGAKYEMITHLTGASSQYDFDMARDSLIVVATMEQATPLLKLSHFDYVFIDEFHGLITSNQYKRDQVSELTSILESKEDLKVVGLTGTPLEIIRCLGYGLVSVEKRNQEPVEIIQRTSNFKPYNILLQHQSEVEGKAIYRLNITDDLKTFKNQMVSEGHYKEDEVLVLHADPKVKSGEDFKNLLEDGAFRDSVKIVLTTSIIDEGISLEQKGFTDVVFIDGVSYNPRPEAVKQFFARFRDHDPNRRNYYYRKARKMDHGYNSIIEEYTNIIKELEHYREIDSDLKGVFNSDEYLYSNNKVNPYFVAFKASQSYFERLSPFEFKRFLESNYNIALISDESYTVVRQDMSYRNKSRQTQNKKINEYWKDETDEIYSYVRLNTQDNVLKASLEQFQFPIDTESYNFFRSHNKAFEGYVKHAQSLDNMRLRLDKFLHKSTGDLHTMNALNNQMIVASFLYFYFLDRREQGTSSKSPYYGFIDHFSSLSSFCFSEIETFIGKINPRVEVKKVVFIGILRCFMKLTYDKRRKIYKVGKIYDLEWVHNEFFIKDNNNLKCYPSSITKVDQIKQLRIFP